jgi:mevalonate kinase
MSDRVICSAPGKIILFGEHAVVLGKSAVSAAINKRTYIVIEKHNELEVVFNVMNYQHFNWKLIENDGKGLFFYEGNIPDVNQPEMVVDIVDFLSSKIPESNMKTWLLAFWFLFICIGRNTLIGTKIFLFSEIFPGVGLGSSASYSVCLAASLLKYFGYIKNDSFSSEDLDLINKWGFTVEKIFHGNPSGIDNTTCTFGGAVFFEKGRMERLGTPPFQIIITNSKIQRNTKTLIKKVLALHRLLPDVTQGLLDSVDQISKRFFFSLSPISY